MSSSNFHAGMHMDLSPRCSLSQHRSFSPSPAASSAHPAATTSSAALSSSSHVFTRALSAAEDRDVAMYMDTPVSPTLHAPAASMHTHGVHTLASEEGSDPSTVRRKRLASARSVSLPTESFASLSQADSHSRAPGPASTCTSPRAFAGFSSPMFTVHDPSSSDSASSSLPHFSQPLQYSESTNSTGSVAFSLRDLSLAQRPHTPPSFTNSTAAASPLATGSIAATSSMPGTASSHVSAPASAASSTHAHHSKRLSLSRQSPALLRRSSEVEKLDRVESSDHQTGGFSPRPGRIQKPLRSPHLRRRTRVATLVELCLVQACSTWKMSQIPTHLSRDSSGPISSVRACNSNDSESSSPSTHADKSNSSAASLSLATDTRGSVRNPFSLSASSDSILSDTPTCSSSASASDHSPFDGAFTSSSSLHRRSSSRRHQRSPSATATDSRSYSPLGSTSPLPPPRLSASSSASASASASSCSSASLSSAPSSCSSSSCSPSTSSTAQLLHPVEGTTTFGTAGSSSTHPSAHQPTPLPHVFPSMLSSPFGGTQASGVYSHQQHLTASCSASSSSPSVWSTVHYRSDSTAPPLFTSVSSPSSQATSPRQRRRLRRSSSLPLPLQRSPAQPICPGAQDEVLDPTSMATESPPDAFDCSPPEFYPMLGGSSSFT